MAYKDYSSIVENARAKKKDEEANMTASSSKIKDYSSIVDKAMLSKTINLDTLESDLKTTAKTIDSIYNGWQTAETMENTLSSVKSLHSRLEKYNEYQKKYGGTDLTELTDNYSKVIEGWSGLTESYAPYKNADAYNHEKEVLSNLAKMTSKDIEPYLKKENKSIPTTYEAGSPKLDTALEQHLGYDPLAGTFTEDGTEGLTTNEGGIAHTTVSGQNITWQQLYDEKKKQEDHDALYKEISSNPDFEKYKSIAENVENPTPNEAEPNITIAGMGIGGTEPLNRVKYAFDNALLLGLGEVNGGGSDYAKAYYTMINDEEYDIYNFKLGQELEGKLEKGTAQKYLDSIDKELKKRFENRMVESASKVAKENPIAMSTFSVGTSLASVVEYVMDSVNYAKTGELDDNVLARMTSGIRGSVMEETDWQVGDWDAFDFAYGTGMSMADTGVASALPGGAGAIILGGSAAAQATNDALDRGLSQGDAFTTGLVSGVFEGLFERYSIGKFKALKDAPVAGVKSVIKNIGKSMLTNASEETLTELANLTYDYIANGDLSQAKTNYRAYVNSGMSEADAKSKVIGELSQQVVESGLSGALMGFGFGGVAQASATYNSYSTGKSIRGNERAGDVLNLASMSPAESDAYKAYTEYAKKGVNADNISNTKLGALHNQAYADAVAVLNSKDATAEQRESAMNTIRDLEAYAQKSAVTKLNAKDFSEEDIDVLINDALENDKETESYKLATEYKTKIESGKKLTTKEIQRLLKANDEVYRPEEMADIEAQLTELGETGDVAKVADAIIKKQSGEILTTEEVNIIKESKYGKAVAEGKSIEDIKDTEAALDPSKNRTLTDDEAKLFKDLYDDSVDIDDYRDSFNLVLNYAKKDFSQDYILKHRGALTTSQVSAIYSATVKAKVKAQVDKITKANEKMAKGMTYKGVIDDRVIDYKNTNAKGKVNWKDLSERQRKAITFIKGFAKAVGMNLKLTTEGTKKNYNGYFDPDTNTIFIDVNAGIIESKQKLEDTLITTFSHEVTHWMKDKAPELYRQMEELAFEFLTKASGLTEADLIATELLKPDIKNEQEARAEIVARACEDMLSMSEEGKRLFNSLSASEQQTLKDKILDLLEKVKEWIADLLSSYKADSWEAKQLRGCEAYVNELSKKWDAVLVEAVKGNQALELSGEYVHSENITSIGATELSDLSEAEGTDGKKIFQYRAIVEDKDIYRAMLLKHKDTIGITNKQIDDLFNMIDKAVDIISENLEALDYAWDADINERGFMPVKPNSDTLYKVSLDFSTLCRKRLLQQSIQSLLQKTLDKQLSREEAIAIRDELLKVQEEGRKIEVACALCYVESARMTAPKQITKFLNNREAVIREFFATRSGGSIKEKIAKAEMKARESLKKANPDGLVGKNGVILDALTAPKSHMLKADADYIRAEGKKAKTSYKLTSHEQAELDLALKMSVDDFTSAKGLENLAKHHRDLFDAYASFIRNATHSKGIENDTWWRAGDSEVIGDNLIAQMNAENGLRSQSWSDFQVIHLLDYIAATIELSTRGAKRQSYTKVPDYVKLLGNTGDMINMSIIPERAFSGKLGYDDVEGMAYKIAVELREQFHETAGIICIGMKNEQIRLLLADNTIDMVIPYHKSRMSKATKKAMHIPEWDDYEPYQIEKNLSDADAKARAKEYGVELDKASKLYGKAPKFSEWFDLEESRQIAKMENANPSDAKAKAQYGVMYGGYKAMQYAANNYLKLCAERGLAPKFSHQNADFTKEANYWKLLIDRKMVDNVTGEIIEQKAIKPIFNEDHILEILNDELARYPQVKADQEYATRKVVGKFLSGEMKVDKSTLEAIQKTVDNVTNVNILESSKGKKQFQSRDADYMDAVKKGDMETAQKMVDEKAKEAGYNSPMLYHGTDHFGFTVVDTSANHGDGISFWASNKKETSSTYTTIPKVRRITEGYDESIAEEVFDEVDSDIDDAIDEFCRKIDRYFSEWVFGYSGGNSVVKGIVEKYFDKDIETVTDGGLYEELLDIISDAYYDFGEQYQDEYEEFAEWQDNSKEWEDIEEKIVALESLIIKRNSVYDKYETSGIYSLYANTDNFFEIDGNGTNWNNIRSTKLPPLNRYGIKDAPYDTREVVKWAKENGYDGVIFRNIKDNGGKGYAGLNDVYAFFNPESQVKSADPVTYDDDGNVIPLSERFNEGKKDIRYQRRDTEIDGPSYDDLIKKPPVAIVDIGINEQNLSYAELKARAIAKAKDEGWFNNPHHNKDTGFNIFVSEDSYSHAYSNLTATFGEDTILAMEHVPEIIENAILTKVDNPKDLTKSEKRVYSFFGAVRGKNGVEPVKITVKEYDSDTIGTMPENVKNYFDKNKKQPDYHRLYDAKVLEVVSIEKEPNASASVSTPSRVDAKGTFDSNISVADLLNLVNGDARKYIPAKPSTEDSDYETIPYHHTAILKESTIDKYLKDFASKSTPNYAQAYIAYVRPNQFLKLTTSGVLSRMQIEKESTKLDEKNFAEATQHQPIYLRIDHETGKVLGHEGRHRMVALRDEGITNIPVLLFDSGNKNSKEIIAKQALIGQFSEYELAFVEDVIPFNFANRDLIIEKFGTMSREQKSFERWGIKKPFQYQSRDTTTIHDVVGETERLKAENEKLKADFEALKERLALEKKVTHGTYFNEKHLDMVARHLLKTANSTYAKADLVNQLKDVYSYIARNAISKDSEVHGITESYAYGLCHEIATDMLKEKRAEIEVNEYAKEFLRDMKKMRISLNETQIAEAKYRFGENYHRAFFGKVILAKDGIPLDDAWRELSNLYPDVFDADTNDADQVSALFDGIAAMRQASEILVEYNAEEEARWLTVEIFNKFWTVSAIETTADKYDKRIRQLNLEHRKRFAELRNAYNDRLKEQHKADKAKFIELASKIRADRDTKVADAKKHGREKLAQYRENAERKTRIQRITQNALTLNEWLVKNSKDKHIHESLKGPVITLLNAIDFSSKRMLEKGEPTKKDISLAKALSKVHMMMVKASEGPAELVELYGHGLDEDIENMMKSVDAIVETIGENEFTLNEMTLTDLETLDKIVKTIKSAVTKMNKFHAINHAKGIAHLSQESMSYLNSLGKAKVYDGLKGSAQKLLEWNNTLPYYAFKRYGSGGMKVYEALQDGWDKFSFNIKEIIDYSNRVYTSKEVNEWSESVKSFRILLPATEYDLSNPKYEPQYQEVKMTVSQVMSLYCLQKREQAKGHLLGGGIRVADFKDSKGKIISQSEGVVLTQSDIDNIIGSLTSRQKAVADKLQEFMNGTCSEWGNEVSMLRFGYKAFGEKNYFPIQSDKNNLAVDDETDKVNSLFRLLNMSFTKSLSDKANNRAVISDIFDVFAQHTSDMAKYNALALPVLDAFKWYNYTEKQELSGGAFKTMGVKQSLESAFGKSGQTYFTTFLKDINGQQEVGRDTIGKHLFTSAKVAAVGANLRVMLLQPTSYVRASAIIDNRYLVKALMHKPKISKAEEHCGIALWKSMGYYDTNIQKGVEAQIKHNDTWKDKVVEGTMKGAEVADKITWGYLWNACELEVRATRKDLKVGSKEFYETIGKRLREIIYATQVVDSTMTRSQMMRSNKTYDKMLTAFASEPTLAYNMLQDAYMTMRLDARRMGKKEALQKNGKRIARVLTAYTVTNALAALVESAFDAFRDDDDEEKDLEYFMKLYLSNFLNDMSITAKIPYVKELHSVIKGFGVSRTDTQWMDRMVNAFKGWGKILSGEGNPSKTIKNTLQAISDLFGLPFYNAYRDIMATLDNLEIFTADDLNEMFGDDSD